MDDNNDIVRNGEPIAHKDVDDLQENENIANLENIPFTETEIIDFVKLYLTEVSTSLVTETNRFAEQFLAAAAEKTRTNSYVGNGCP